MRSVLVMDFPASVASLHLQPVVLRCFGHVVGNRLSGPALMYRHLAYYSLKTFSVNLEMDVSNPINILLLELCQLLKNSIDDKWPGFLPS